MASRVMLKVFQLLLVACRASQEIADFVEKNAPKGDIDAALDTFIRFSEQNQLGMHLGHQKGQNILYSVMKGKPQTGPVTVLELGCHAGDGTLSIFKALQDRPGSTIISTESNKGWLKTAKRIVAHATNGLSVRWIPLLVPDKTDFPEFLRKLKDDFQLGAFDSMVFDHEEKRFLPDLKTVLDQKMLRAGGTVQIDNVKRKARALAEYMDFVKPGRNGFSTTVVQVDEPYPDAVAISQLLEQTEL
mmetsp:Transcript_32581/g.40082  ORF Transcript_32581/g.40082 Transcript_32581/m.40082 type:complete len:245 (+) Transcript_32581:57-791(+)